MKRLLSLLLALVLALSAAAFAEGKPEFSGMNDPSLLQYIEDDLYENLVTSLDSDEYFVENVQAVYISQEYLDEIAYNSQSNVFFGFTLAELEAQFSGERYVFTLGDDGTTQVQPFEDYDDTYDRILHNVAVGTGVILICVTVSVVTGGAAPAVSMIFAMSAKTATVAGVSGGLLGGVASGIVTGIQTHDWDAALKAAALTGSENFKWGSITGAIGGGASEAMALKGATLNGLSMNEAAMIQRESGYPLDVIKQFNNIEQYNICKEAGLTRQIVDGKAALIRSIDLNYVDEHGLTNLQRMKNGLAALDPATGQAYELHHIGQKMDSTLAILTKAEHMQNGNNKIWHLLEGESAIDRPIFDKQRIAFWKHLAEMLA